MPRRVLDVVLYGGALTLAVGAGIWAVTHRESEQVPEAPRTIRPPSASEREQEPAIVPSLPDVPDLETEPPPPRPAGRDPRNAELAEEMRYLSRARELLERQPREALAILEEHRQHHPSGILREEREAFAIEALVAVDRRTEAERRYYDFIRAYPSSDFSSRLATLMR